MIIVSPTRELSMQTFGVLREVMQEHTQTYGLVMGGADRKSEAVKLAKGKYLHLGASTSPKKHSTYLLIYDVCVIQEAPYQRDGYYRQLEGAESATTGLCSNTIVYTNNMPAFNM